MSHVITTLSELEALYGEVNKGSLVKETDRVVPEYRAFIEAAPFVALATRGPEGLDCSPRGDGPGFVRVQDEKTLLLPTGAATTASILCATSCAIRASPCCS